MPLALFQTSNEYGSNCSAVASATVFHKVKYGLNVLTKLPLEDIRILTVLHIQAQGMSQAVKYAQELNHAFQNKDANKW